MNVVATDRKIAMLKTASDPGHRKALETPKSHFKIGFFKLSNHQNLDYFHMKNHQKSLFAVIKKSYVVLSKSSFRTKIGL